jgi:hypothetical protein
MSKILTDSQEALSLFEDAIQINKSLPKWKEAEKGLEKTTVNSNITSNTNTVLIGNPFITEGTSGAGDDFDSIDIDSQVDMSTRWLPLYEVADGVNFSELAMAGIKELNRLIAENKLKFVIGKYGSLGNTRSSLSTYFNSEVVINTPDGYDSSNLYKKSKKLSFKERFNKIKNLFAKKTPEYKFDALEFFSLVKLTSKENASLYKDRVENYLIAISNAIKSGQTALMEELLRGLVTNKYESVLNAEGLHYIINENQMVSFIKECEKGICLDYIKNFSRPIPTEVVNKIDEVNKLEIFDNYVVLYYDPKGEVFKETAREEAKRKDPILFGVLAGSRKLYYITDWVDEYCDLSLEKFVDTIGVKKEELKIDYKPSSEKKETGEENKKKKRKNNKKNNKKGDS